MQKNQPQSFHEDFKVGKAFDRGLMGRLLRYALPHRHLIILALLLLWIPRDRRVENIHATALNISRPLRKPV